MSSAAIAASRNNGGRAGVDAKNPNGLRVFGVGEAAQQRAFSKLDADGDGGVTTEELKGLAGLGGGKNDPAAFAALDSDGDGKLAFRELQASQIFSPSTLGDLLGAQSGQGLAGWLASEGDSDGDGALSLDEFRAVGPSGEYEPHVLADGSLSQDPLDQILGKADRAFAAADADQDGKVTAEELGAVMTAFGRQLSAASHATMAVTLMSQDLDASGGLSKAEIGDASKPWLDTDSAFATLDADGDGELSAAELEARASDASADDGEATDGRTPPMVEVPPGDLALMRLFGQVANRLVDEMIATARARSFVDV